MLQQRPLLCIYLVVTPKNFMTFSKLLHFASPVLISGPPSGRSSSNRSNSLFTSGDLASSSVSPNFLLTAVTSAFNNMQQRQSPSSITSISPLALTTNTNNRYSQQKVESSSKQSANQNQLGSSAQGARNDQHMQPIVSYIVRFLGNDCGAEQCRFSTSREHFHCKLCNNKVSHFGNDYEVKSYLALHDFRAHYMRCWVLANNTCWFEGVRPIREHQWPSRILREVGQKGRNSGC